MPSGPTRQAILLGAILVLAGSAWSLLRSLVHPELASPVASGVTLPDVFGIGGRTRPGIEPLREEDAERLASQRAHVAPLARRQGRPLDGTRDDLDTLDRILASGAVARDDVATQQALGVALGDVLAHELGLRWVSFRDELGASRALQVPGCDQLIFPVTMISKRFERGLPVDLEELFRKAQEVASAGCAGSP